MYIPVLVAAALLGVNVEIGSALPRKVANPDLNWGDDTNLENTNTNTGLSETPSPTVTTGPSQTLPVVGAHSQSPCGSGSIWVTPGITQSSAFPWFDVNAVPKPGASGVCSALYPPGVVPTDGSGGGTENIPISIPSSTGGATGLPSPVVSPSATPSGGNTGSISPSIPSSTKGTQDIPISIPSTGGATGSPSPSVSPSVTSSEGGEITLPTSDPSSTGGDDSAPTPSNSPSPSSTRSSSPNPTGICNISVKQAIPAGDENGDVFIAGYAAQGREKVLANLSKGTEFGKALEMKPRDSQEDLDSLSITPKKSGDKADDLLKQLKESKVEHVNEVEQDPFPVEFSYKKEQWKSGDETCKVGKWKTEAFFNFDDKKLLGEKVAWRLVECSYQC